MGSFKAFLIIAVLAFLACDVSAKKAHTAVHHRAHSATGTEAPADPTTVTDAAPTEAAPTDAAPTDAAPTDAAPTDAAPTDAAPTDAPTDAAPTDAAPTDAAPTDATADPAPETSTTDVTTTADTGAVDTTGSAVDAVDPIQTLGGASGSAGPSEGTGAASTSGAADAATASASGSATAASEAVAAGSGSGTVEPAVFVCTPRPAVPNLEAICWNVQEWINNNRDADGYTAQGCQIDVHELSIAKDLMKETDACFLDWPTPNHLMASHAAGRPDVPAMFLEKETSATSKRLAKVKRVDFSKAHSKAIRMLRDQFITRIEDVLLCDIPASDYCPIPVTHDCTPNCDSDSGVVPHGMVLAATGHIEGARVPVVCADVVDKDTCVAAVTDCMWLFSACVTRFEVVSPCTEIIDCDECRADDACFWSTAVGSCGPKATETTSV